MSIFDTAHGNIALTPISSGGRASFDYDALDASGKLYVTSGFANNVSVFDTTNGNAALGTIGGGLSDPLGVAVDASGRLYLANINAGSVSVFDTAHNNVPLATISGTGLPISIPAPWQSTRAGSSTSRPPTTVWTSSTRRTTTFFSPRSPAAA